MKDVIFVGHRGGKINGGVENTKEAFIGGVYVGNQALECDVRVTKDGVFIIHHDNTLERLTEYSDIKSDLDVNEVDYEDIKDIILTQKYNDTTYQGQICKLEEYLQICAEYQIIPIIEIKWTNGMYSSNISIDNYDYSKLDELVELIKKYNLYKRAYVMTSMRGVLQYLRDHYRDIKLQWLCGVGCMEYLNWCIENNISIDIQYEVCNKFIVEFCHKHSLIVNIWTLNEQDKLEHFIDMGVDMITTDRIMPVKNKH